MKINIYILLPAQPDRYLFIYLQHYKNKHLFTALQEINLYLQHYKKRLDAYKLSLEVTKRKKFDTSTQLACKKLKTAQKFAISEHVRLLTLILVHKW